MSNPSDKSGDKSGLRGVLTTTGGGAKKGGDLARALGGATPAVFTTRRPIQTVSADTRSVLGIQPGADGERDKGQLAYVIDATASRSGAWKEAQRIQRRMFEETQKIGNLNVRLVHFGGGAVTDRGWFRDPKVLMDVMEQVKCVTGETCIRDSIRSIIENPEGGLPRNIIMIGDCCEEVDVVVFDAAQELVRAGIKVFAFHEDTSMTHGDRLSIENGRRVYQQLAKMTGGAFQQFGANMALEELCEAVAVYTVGGEEALRKLGSRSKAAQLIGRQVLGLSDQRNDGPKPKA